MDPNIIDKLLQRFETATQAGYVNVGGATISILWMLAGISLALAVVWNLFGGKTPWMALFSKFILIGFFVWLIEGWPEIIKQVQHTFIQVGLMAGDGSMSAADFLKPSEISKHGEEVAGVLFKAAAETKFGWTDWGASAVRWLGFYLAGWFVMFSYWLTALMVLLSQVVFFVSSIIALFMTAFMVFTGTAWMGRGALGYLVSAGTMLMALAVVTSIMLPVFKALAFDTVDEYAANQAVLGSLIMISLVLGSGSIARGVGNGVASWGTGSAMEAAGAVGVAAAAATAGAAMIAGPAARAAMAQMGGAGALAAPKMSAEGVMAAMSKNSPAGKLEDMSINGRSASMANAAKGAGSQGSRISLGASGGAGSGSNSNAAKGSVSGSSRATRQIENRQQLPSGVSSIMLTRAAVPKPAEDGAALSPDHIG